MSNRLHSLPCPSACECHERDGSQVCPACYAEGERGHMQGDECPWCGALPSHPCAFDLDRPVCEPKDP